MYFIPRAPRDLRRTDLICHVEKQKPPPPLSDRAVSSSNARSSPVSTERQSRSRYHHMTFHINTMDARGR